MVQPADVGASRGQGRAVRRCHVLAQAAITMLCVQHFSPLSGWRVLLCMVLVGLVGGVVGSTIFATFLFLWFTLFGWNSTEAFSSFRYTGYKNFLRMRITDKAVTVYPIRIDKICTKWDYDPDNPSPEASWLKPRTGTIQTRLIEPEFTVLAPTPSESRTSANSANSDKSEIRQPQTLS
jgi:hypothetical protein